MLAAIAGGLFYATVEWDGAESLTMAGGGVSCSSPRVVDGDSLRCGETRVRLEGIDAPEMPGACRPGRRCLPGDPYASRDNLEALVNGAAIMCRKTNTDRDGRTVARCTANGRDLSCAQVEGGFAIKRYAPLSC